MKILAVDNDLHALDQLQDCLNMVFPTFEVITFHDSLLSIKYIKNHPSEIKAVFVALLMQHMDGLQLMKLLHIYAPGTPAYVTAHTNTLEIQTLIWLYGANGYLPKPVTAKAIQEVIAICET